MVYKGFNFYIGGIEDAIIAKLKASLSVEKDGYVKTIRSYTGELDIEAIRQALNSLQGLAPLMLVACVKNPYDRINRKAPLAGVPEVYRGTPEFVVLAGSTDTRGDEARRRGAEGGVGVYQMIEDIHFELDSETFTVPDPDDSSKEIILNTLPMVPLGDEERARLQNFTAFGVYFQTEYQYTTPDRRPAAGADLKEIVFGVDIANPDGRVDNGVPGVTATLP